MDIRTFEELPKAQQRVEIARDVLFQIKNDNYIPVTGRYIDVDHCNYHNIKYLHDESARENINLFNNCKVCALGACLISMVRLANKLSVDDLYSERYTSWKMLSNYFPLNQLVEMEYSFEGFLTKTCGKANDFEISLSNETIRKTSAFHNKYKSKEDRLEAIMENIIENEGEFII